MYRLAGLAPLLGDRAVQNRTKVPGAFWGGGRYYVFRFATCRLCEGCSRIIFVSLVFFYLFRSGFYLARCRTRVVRAIRFGGRERRSMRYLQ